MGKNNYEVYRELSPAGIWLCAGLGIIAEGLVFWLFGIRLASVPVLVMIFLWVLFGVLTAGLLFVADAAEMKLQEVVRWIRSKNHLNLQESYCTVLLQEEENCTDNEGTYTAEIIYGIFSKKDADDFVFTQKKAS